jgi:histidyl-tRNA synthetase
MRDHAPEAASARRRIVDGLLATFERHGFARVITPAKWWRCGPTSRRRSRG